MGISTTDGVSTSMAARVAFWGPTIAGIAGIILAINAALDNQFTGAGLLILGSAAAFGAIGYSLRRG